MGRGRTTRALSFHARYGCRSSGACCTSSWPIPIEPGDDRALRAALTSGRLKAPLAHDPRLFVRDGLLAADSRGRCVFFDAHGDRKCEIHRSLGHAALPASCRHFPRVARIERESVSITLSHYCPTAAALLAGYGGPTTIVENPAAFPPMSEYEGLDVRAHGPLLRPDVLMGKDVLARFERHAVALLADGQGPIAARVAALRHVADHLATWRAGDGPLEGRFEALVGRTPPNQDAARCDFTRTASLWEEVISAIPLTESRPVLPAAWETAYERWVAPALPAVAPVVGRYLAAKAFASWCAYQGPGIRATVRGLEAALAVLAIECARACAERERDLDADRLVAAVRTSDLVLVHLVEPLALARRLGAAEYTQR